MRILNKIAIGVIFIYQKLFSPSVGFLRYIPFYPKPSCIFYPTCSDYAILSYKKYPFITATKKTILRISRCHPGNLPDIDYP